jgi:hypothetical protein
LEADGITKKNVQKIFGHEKPGKWGVSFGCSGSAASCSNFGDRLLEQLRAESNFNRRTMEKTIEAHMHYMGREYPDERLQVVLGLYNTKPLETRLYKAETGAQCLAVHSDYACAGMDVSLARFILDSIFTGPDDVTVNDGMYLAAFVINIMKEKADGVGGPAQLRIYQINRKQWLKPTPETLAKIEQGGFIEGSFRFADLEKSVRQFCWSRFPHKFRPA